MNNYFYGEISVKNNLTGQIMSSDDLLFTIDTSTISLFFNDKLIISTSDLDAIGKPKSYQIFKKFDREILWDFGDGTQVRGLSATHTYKQPGNYSISCTCFDSDGNPYQNYYSSPTNQVKVIDILNTTLIYREDYIKKVNDGLLSDVYAGEIIEIGGVLSTLNKTIEKKVPIKCFTVNANSTNVFDLDVKSSFEHLLPYNTFLTKENQPTLSFLPEYYNVYCSLSYDNEINLALYIVIPDLIEDVNLYKIQLDKNFPYSYKTYIVDNINNITNSRYIGQIGITDIFYRDDVPDDNVEVTFVLDQSYFPNTNILQSENVINLVSIGTSVKIKGNLLTGDEIIFISTNGLSTSDDITSSKLIDNKFSYKRAKYIDKEAPFIIRIISNSSNPYFIKDLKIKSISLSPGSIIPVNSLIVNLYPDMIGDNNLQYINFGSCFCSIVPKIETVDRLSSLDIDIILEDIDNNLTSNTLSINDLTLIDFKSFKDSTSQYYLDPKQNYIDYSADEIWKTYKTHPVFDDVPVLDNYMISILKNDNFIQKVINKGWNFIDDISNIDTCSIKNLVSVLDSINLKIDLYNNENFSKPDVINQILKIFSIAHSKLIGSPSVNKIINTNNVGDLINIEDKIYIPKINDKFIWPTILVYDKFTKIYRTINTALLSMAALSPIKEDIKGSYFQISDYTKAWGWNLLINEPITHKDINHFYDFYQYIDLEEIAISNSYLKPETISENIKDHTIWYKSDGSIDRLLYKTLIENLNLD